jgi:hypothetical protein
LSRRGRSLPANAGGSDTHRDSITSRLDAMATKVDTSALQRLEALIGACGGRGAASICGGVLTASYLCAVCACHETARRNGLRKARKLMKS